ncbi:substrate-binding domain-containing protein [Vibrio sp. S4M6]|uniref:substrate-binding domain-containing protein n=1 Tax=Vibrio sinus TaxID=2946865 RepID=UPI00202A7032|nr:substrate-binding domain-containing protein [Vibrio sinus]MCL9781374.1 substrate-binding domain-containing protein [Vibrio sinus]
MTLFRVCLLCAFSFSSFASEELRFLVVPKALDNPFFDEARKGCTKAAEELGVTCIFDGPSKAKARDQNAVILSHLQNDEAIDGLALSVIHSKWLADRSMQIIRDTGIPVVTFDSDFSQDVLSSRPNIRKSYIGTNNLTFGEKLGEAVRKLKPSGGVYCSISGHKSAINLTRRLDGIKGILETADKKWTSHPRCPLYIDDDPKRALVVLERMIQEHQHSPKKLQVVVTIGSWPQNLQDEYRRVISKYKHYLDTKQLLLVFGDTLPIQLELLSEGLAHANIGQSPFAMGYTSIYKLYDLHQNKQIKNVYYTPLIECYAGPPPCVQRTSNHL